MYIEVDRQQLRLLDAHNFRAFKVVVLSGDPDCASIAANFGADAWPHDGNEIFVRLHAILRLAGPLADDAGWIEGFDGMMAYARSAGWVSDDAIRLHCEWPEHQHIVAARAVRP